MRVLWLTNIVDSSDGGMVNGLFPTLRQAMGLSLVHLSILTNIKKVVNVIFGPLWAMAVDRTSLVWFMLD
jgi:hypothetical protein